MEETLPIFSGKKNERPLKKGNEKEGSKEKKRSVTGGKGRGERSTYRYKKERIANEPNMFGSLGGQSKKRERTRWPGTGIKKCSMPGGDD